ncbi:MAG: ABC transporter ATP-binding protein [Chloroflexota bacterium]|nr:ABC transporter ATP-binding protein [Chloroflexota bacterium]MDP6758286.1 ABC transporter ATP-binding protein [Chloroflexota bacterium]
MVRVRNLRKVYKGGVVANDDISLDIRAGEVLGLLGANGAGKTTLIMQMLGLLKATAGSVEVLGHDVVADASAAKAPVNYLPQGQISHRELKVDRALYITGRLRGLAGPEAAAQPEHWIERLDLREMRGRAVEKLSGGMNRLASFAITLMVNPRLIVLDEPTSELDPVRRRQIWDIVKELNADGVTVVLVTHNVLEAERVIQRVAIVSNGSIRAMGSPGELKERLGDEVRLEIVLRVGNGNGNGAARLREVLAPLEPVEVRPGRFITISPRTDAGRYVDRILTGLDGALDDFRVAPPTLEDVYVQL